MAELTPKQRLFVAEYLKDLNATQAAIRAGVELIEKPSGYYVYILIGSDGRIVYVGKGKGRRMHQHMKDAKAGRVSSIKKHRGLMTMLSNGDEPKAFAIVDNLSDDDAYRVERSVIHKIGHDRLLNSSAGNRSPLEAQFEKIKQMERDAMPYETWLHLRPRTDLEKQAAKAFHGSLAKLKSETMWQLALSGYPLDHLK